VEIQEIQQMSQLSTPVNHRLKRRTIIAVLVVVGTIFGIALWSNHQVSKTAKSYERHRIVGESLAHVERQLILDGIEAIKFGLSSHMSYLPTDRNAVKELDSLYLENLQQQKK